MNLYQWSRTALGIIAVTLTSPAFGQQVLPMAQGANLEAVDPALAGEAGDTSIASCLQPGASTESPIFARNQKHADNTRDRSLSLSVDENCEQLRRAFQTLKNPASVPPETARFRRGSFVVTTADPMKRLFKSPNAGELFKKLYREADLAGKLYALSGLYYTDKQFYNQALNILLREAGLDQVTEQCHEKASPKAWSSLLDGFETRDGKAPEYPSKVWAKSGPARLQIEDYLAKGGLPNGQWNEYHSGDRNTLLTFAAASGELDALEYALGLGVDSSLEHNMGMSLHAMYAACGSTEAVQRIVNSGADINAQQANGYTALHWAVRNGKLDTVRWLLGHGANPNLKDSENETPFHIAIRSDAGQQIVELLIQYGADGLLTDSSGWSAPDLAILYGQPSLLKRLLTTIPDQEFHSEAGSHLLLRAIELEDAISVEMLLEKGAKVTLDHSEIASLISKLIDARCFQIIERLIRYGVKPDLGLTGYGYRPDIRPLGSKFLTAAIEGNRPYLVQYAISSGVTLDPRNEEEYQLLQLAAIEYHQDTIYLLLRATAISNLSPEQKNDLYCIARVRGFKKMARMLQTNMPKGHTPSTRLFLEAVRRSDEQLILDLLGLGAEIDAQLPAQQLQEDGLEDSGPAYTSDREGIGTALHIAAAGGSIHLMRLLLANGANPNVAEQYQGNTPLMELFEHHSLQASDLKEAARLLVSYGADTELMNSNGKSVLFAMVEEKRLEEVQILIDLGASISARDAKGRTPLQAAEKCDSGCEQNPAIPLEQKCIAALLSAYGAEN